MASIDESGTSQLGLQTLILFPYTYKRVFVWTTDSSPESSIKTGTVLYGINYPGEDRTYVFKTQNFYREAVVLIGLPPIAEEAGGQYSVRVQWRQSGLPWVAYADDA